MAKNKEINVFSVSFLDLLSGALAAVIILFVVVPKASLEQVEALETLERIELTVEELESVIEQAQNSVPQDIYNEIMQQVENLKQIISQHQQQIEELQSQLAQCQQAQTIVQHQLEDVTQQLQSAQARVNELEEIAARGAGGPGASMFGVNAVFAVVCDWPENLDVDLYLQNLANGEWICYNCGTHNWGSYLGDVTSREQGDGQFEMIYQQENIISGEYEVWYHVYSSTGNASITGYAVIHPFTAREQKIKFDNVTLSNTAKPTSGGGKRIGILRVTDNSLQLIR